MSFSSVPSLRSGTASPSKATSSITQSQLQNVLSPSSLSNRSSSPVPSAATANPATFLPWTTSQGKLYKSVGEEASKKCEKTNAEMFIFTYGAIVAQMTRDFDNCNKVNEELYKMGYNMGIRLIEDFLAKSGWTRCSDFRETAQIISAVAFKMFLNCCPRVREIQETDNEADKDKEFGLVFTSEGESALPLYEFVNLPDELVKEGLIYGNILPGLIKGALEMIQLDCDCWFETDQLKGDERTELRIKLNRIIEEELPPGE